MLNTVNHSAAPQLKTISPSNPKLSSPGATNAPTTQARPLGTTPANSSNALTLSRLASQALVSPATLNQNAINILKRPPFKPTDISVFNQEVYGTTKAQPAAPRTQTLTQIKGELTKTFNKRFNGNTTAVKNAVALMDNPQLKHNVPDARLRAAIVNLQGTAGAAAITAYKDGTFAATRFSNLPSSFIAHSITPGGKTKPEVEFNSRYQNEDFRLLSGTMAHEVLHQDKSNSAAEEMIAHSMDTMIHGQMVLEDPSLIKTPTEFTQRLNTKLLARLNSRDAKGNLRLFTAQSNVFPGGKVPLANFGAAFNANGLDSPGITVGPTSPGNSVLRGMLKSITGQNVPTANFDDPTKALLDQHQIVFTPVQLVNLAKILKLNLGS